MKQKFRTGFTLVELLIVIVILAVLSSIAIPKFASGWRASSESRLKENLHEYRNAIERFHNDTGLYPASLSDVRKQTAPSSGLNQSGSSRSIPSGSWQGPYMLYQSGSKLVHPDLRNIGLNYETSGSKIGTVTINSSMMDLYGIRLNTW